MSKKVPEVKPEEEEPQRRRLPMLRLICLLAAIGIYAFLGSPTPDNPGMIEMVIGGFLILAAGIPAAAGGVTIDMQAPLWRALAQALLIFGLTLPLGTGVMAGHPPMLILRDVIPFIFLLLPLFLSRILSFDDQYYRAFLVALVCLGLVFALRSVSDTYDQILSFIRPDGADELTYLANAPTVLFAGLFLLGSGAQAFLNDRAGKNVLLFVVFTALAVLAFLPVGMTVQRASLGYIALFVMVLMAVALYRYPLRALIPAAALALAGFLAWPVLGTLFDIALQKTFDVGMNMRAEELKAVWRAISASGWHIIFGTGWGGTFHSPAVGGMNVNFTHGLLTGMLLKTGFVGLFITAAYLTALGRILWDQLKSYPVLVLALAGPFLIDIFFYAAFKSLDFGLILLAIAVLAARPVNLAYKR